MQKNIYTRAAFCFLTIARRAIVKFYFLEKILVKFSHDKNPENIIIRIFRANYLYPTDSIRNASRGGIFYKLHIHDSIDWYIYLGLKEKAHENLIEICNSNSIVIDIGSNVGSVLMKLAQKCSEGFVYGFEPDQKNFYRMSENLRLNKLKNYKIFNYALGAEESLAYIQEIDKANSGRNTLTAYPADQATPVKVRALDAVVKELELNKIDIIKIDVEGFEFNVLLGSKETLAKWRPILFVELDDSLLRAQGSSARDLIQLLESDYGYRVFNALTGETVSRDTDFRSCHWDIIATCKV